MDVSKIKYYVDDLLDIMEDENNSYYSAIDKTEFDKEELDEAFKCLSGSKKHSPNDGDLQADNAFTVLNSLKLNPHPTYEELLGIMDSYLIHLISSKYSTYIERHMEELMSQGHIGILLGMKSYDPRLGKPTTWFSRFINHEIQAFFYVLQDAFKSNIPVTPKNLHLVFCHVQLMIKRLDYLIKIEPDDIWDPLREHFKEDQGAVIGSTMPHQIHIMKVTVHSYSNSRRYAANFLPRHVSNHLPADL